MTLKSRLGKSCFPEGGSGVEVKKDKIDDPGEESFEVKTRSS